MKFVDIYRSLKRLLGAVDISSEFGPGIATARAVHYPIPRWCLNNNNNNIQYYTYLIFLSLNSENRSRFRRRTGQQRRRYGSDGLWVESVGGQRRGGRSARKRKSLLNGKLSDNFERDDGQLAVYYSRRTVVSRACVRACVWRRFKNLRGCRRRRHRRCRRAFYTHTPTHIYIRLHGLHTHTRARARTARSRTIR